VTVATPNPGFQTKKKKKKKKPEQTNKNKPELRHMS
jgi:hypothetical protein